MGGTDVYPNDQIWEDGSKGTGGGGNGNCQSGSHVLIAGPSPQEGFIRVRPGSIQRSSMVSWKVYLGIWIVPR